MVIVAVLALFTPLPYAVILPGPSENVLDKTVTILHATAFKPSGKLLSSSVFLSNPDSRMFAPELLRFWIQGNTVIVPRAVVYPKGESAKVADAEGHNQMISSEQTAAQAALAYLKVQPASEVILVPASDIKILLKDTGGPSAGLIFTLGIIAQLFSHDFLHGRTIAGTGTISADGAVGPIGGIDQKMIGAQHKGAQIFLFPLANCSDITRIPNGLMIIPVTTLAQAVHVLDQNGVGEFPRCPTNER